MATAIGVKFANDKRFLNPKNKLYTNAAKIHGNLVNPRRRSVTLYVTVHDKKSLSETVWLTGGKSNCFPFPIWRARASNISFISVTMRNLLDQQL